MGVARLFAIDQTQSNAEYQVAGDVLKERSPVGQCWQLATLYIMALEIWFIRSFRAHIIWIGFQSGSEIVFVRATLIA